MNNDDVKTEVKEAVGRFKRGIENKLYGWAFSKDLQTLLEEVGRCHSLLKDWNEFGEDCNADCAAGQEWLSNLKAKTRQAIDSAREGERG